MSEKALCIHGHFYQPPREDPLTGIIPLEQGASPYHDWNEKILAECYRPNAELGNFERISFNIGPTLFRWMVNEDPMTCSRIVMQDRRNLERYGVGNAMAQAYNHTILPLANRTDKVTQISWGVAEFEYRFNHRPLGMWLPETAVDMETLTVMADCGIEFTILAPWQADTSLFMDSSEPYRVMLPDGRSIMVFFYQQELSTRISFDPGSTSNADNFLINHILPQYKNGFHPDDPAKLLMIASDGELYGHHQRFRDKFLAYLLNDAMRDRNIHVIYPGLWLKQYPTTRTIRVLENTSWSCHHGVTRWMDTCDCTPGNPWKAPLRMALNQLGDKINRLYVDAMKLYGLDPWELRNEYIHVILGEYSVNDLVHSNSRKSFLPEDIQKISILLAAQRERQRMFTSCGWFFDDFDRIEPRNNVAYCTQAVWLTYQATGVNLTNRALDLFKSVKSQRSGLTADGVFNQHLIRAKQALDTPQHLEFVRH